MGSDKHQVKFLLGEKDIPTKWYNIQADLKSPLPPPCTPAPTSLWDRPIWLRSFPWS